MLIMQLIRFTRFHATRYFLGTTAQIEVLYPFCNVLNGQILPTQTYSDITKWTSY
jgi:hypothetical protein